MDTKRWEETLQGLAVKDDVNKPRIDLIPPNTLMRIGRVFAMGARKYGDTNWLKGMRWSRLYAAAMRHLLAYWSGEDLDSESNEYHLVHAICDLMCLLEYYEQHPALDDRRFDYSVNDYSQEYIYDPDDTGTVLEGGAVPIEMTAWSSNKKKERG